VNAITTYFTLSINVIQESQGNAFDYQRGPAQARFGTQIRHPEKMKFPKDHQMVEKSA
jgi:hypothetical protein